MNYKNLSPNTPGHFGEFLKEYIPSADGIDRTYELPDKTAEALYWTRLFTEALNSALVDSLYSLLEYAH